jgi:hypothetical protein
MQVDTSQLRQAAARLRKDVLPQLRRSSSPGSDLNVEGAFDLYTTSAPYAEAADAWTDEIGVLIQAATQLADALESAANDYDKADAGAAQRMTTTR